MNYFISLYGACSKKNYQFATALLFLSLIMNGCQKLVQAPAPITSLNAENVYAGDATAIAVLTGIYTKMSSAGITSGPGATSVFCGLSADEYQLYNPASQSSYAPFYQNALSNENGGGNLWDNFYQLLYTANSAVAGLANNNRLTPAVGRQLLGEAKFIRAFCYFYLVNLYGDIPLVTGTDYTVNGRLPRTSAVQVYGQIRADLTAASALLDSDYVDGTLLSVTPEKVRPTKWAALALLSRICLYTGNWPGAQAAASQVIGHSAYSLTPPGGVFLKNSAEAIWQLQPVASGANTPDGLFFILPVSGPSVAHPVYLNPELVSSFETGDLRLAQWTSSVQVMQSGVPLRYYYPFKYKVNARGAAVTEYEMMFRLGEQYLIRAEARAEQGNLAGAAADLDMIRGRAGLPPTPAATRPAILAAILRERRVELFSESGHRWLDLKRTGAIDTVMAVAAAGKGAVWSPAKALYPLPAGDLQTDPALVQNPGY